MIKENVSRQSGIELLRIVAMFLILHVNYAIGLSGATTSLGAFCRTFIESLAIVSVDVFVLISGWFGINFNIKRIIGFVFQCLFFSIFVTTILWLIKGMPHLDMRSIAGTLFLGKSYYWFVKSYLLLYILAPALNSFIDNSDKRKTGLIILLFFIIMFVYGWSDSMPEFQQGYSSTSFIGLYLLARYVRKYCSNLCSWPAVRYVLIYIASSLTLAIIYLILIRLKASYRIYSCVFSYDNPLVIAGAMSLVLSFAKMNFHSSIINKVAKSSFSVYLLHCGPIAWPLYLSICCQIYQKYSGANMLLTMAAFVAGVFMLAILLDQIRLISWNYLIKKEKND